jgi:hypothetical protein
MGKRMSKTYSERRRGPRAALWILMCVALGGAACASQYKAQPVSFKLPSSYANAQEVEGISVAA